MGTHQWPTRYDVNHAWDRKVGSITAPVNETLAIWWSNDVECFKTAKKIAIFLFYEHLKIINSKMAKLVRVCRNSEEEDGLETYQIPLVIDDELRVCPMPFNVYISIYLPVRESYQLYIASLTMQ